LTLHRAKGLEFDAVFLPKLEHRELPWKLARGEDEIAEERRLLYVGMTRARCWLTLTWTGRPSPFLQELAVVDERAAKPKPREQDLPPVFAALREWRLRRARADGVPAYVVFHDATLAEIAMRAPGSRAELAAVAGIGPTKLDRYAEDILAVLASA
jgi:DNA helicase-2/ATP-dependent DNA helicase PcrA